MHLGGRRAHQGISRIGISLLVLSLVHVPLPQPDYHNVRHHDAPGEVCEHHDHLLRWHPDASEAQDIAIFHWHWFLPSTDPSGPREGAAMHAHVAGWDAPTIEILDPVVTRGPSRPYDPVIPHFAILLATLPLDGHPATVMRSPPCAVHAFCATFAPHTSLSCLLQRWAC